MIILADKFLKQHQIKYVKISNEIIKILELKHIKKDISTDVEKFLNGKLVDYLNLSFDEKIVLWYAELITPEILHIFHNYFRNKCCNIENVIFLTSSSGLTTYYKSYCNLNRSKGMQIVEIPMVDLTDCFDDLKPKTINKNLTRFFSFYGGTRESNPPKKTFLSLFLSQYKEISSIEIMCKCGTLQQLNDWLEYETFFMNAGFVEKYCNLHKTYIDKDLNLSKDLKMNVYKNQVFKEQYGSGDYQEIVDSHCLFTLVRETENFQNFAYISEKTFRCFYNHTIPIPIDGKEVINDFKDYGFWIDEQFFDYSYLQEDLFLNKIEKLEHSINKITKLSYSDLNDYYHANIKNFEHNQLLMINWPNIVETKLNEKIGSNSETKL